MVLVHYFSNRPGEVDELQDVVTKRGMSLDQAELRFRQFSRFAEDFRRHGYLADVVDACRELYSLDPVA